jgi:hypothetical protein
MPEDMIPDEALERELAELGPVMARQSQAEAEPPNEVFLQALRARLVGQRQKQDRPEPPAPIAIKRTRERPRWLWGGGIVAAAAAAALIVFAFNRETATAPTSQHTAFALPTPNPTQLAQSYPLLGGLGAGGGTPPPWENLLQIPSGGAYPGRLRLSASSLPAAASSAHAFQLKDASFDAPRVAELAKALGIQGAVKSSNQPNGRWIYVWELSNNPTRPVNHSVAVSLQTGELIYHNFGGVYDLPRLPLNVPRNVDVAQAWLTRLGWPGRSMMVHAPTSGQERDLTDTVTLSWPGVRAVDVPAAILLINKYGQVEDAHLWPPVAQEGTVSTRPIADAWHDVENGKAPLAVIPRLIGEPFNNGTGELHSATILEVFTQTPSGALYLAPAYRFQGIATIHAVGRRRWFALSPAASP